MCAIKVRVLIRTIMASYTIRIRRDSVRIQNPIIVIIIVCHRLYIIATPIILRSGVAFKHSSRSVERISSERDCSVNLSCGDNFFFFFVYFCRENARYRHGAIYAFIIVPSKVLESLIDTK